MIIVRKEMEQDYSQVYHVVKEAFANAEHTDGNEHDLVSALRESKSFIPELSLVAVDDSRIVGQIMFTTNKVGNTTQLTLAPLSILPKYQRRGVGQMLIKTGHEIAKDMGYEFCIVIGSERYYPKSGYRPAKEFGIVFHGNIPEENFMAINLQGTDKQCPGSLVYPKEFGV